MSGAERREEIVNRIKKSDRPVPAKQLAEAYEVSRQVIVQDIALLRAAGYDILSTNRGYILNSSTAASRVIAVNHSKEQMEGELNLIVDLGGKVLDVRVDHKVYGVMEAPLRITSRKKVREFMEEIQNGKSSPLLTITSGDHYHKVEAESEEILNEIEDALRDAGYLQEKLL